MEYDRQLGEMYRNQRSLAQMKEKAQRERAAGAAQSEEVRQAQLAKR